MNLNKKLTKSAFRQKADRILMRLSMDVTPFWEDSEDKREQRIKKAESDPLYFCRTYLPHYFSHAPAPFHYELVRFMEERGKVVTPAVVAAPREFAKTTVCSFGYVLHQICFKRRFHHHRQRHRGPGQRSHRLPLPGNAVQRAAAAGFRGAGAGEQAGGRLRHDQHVRVKARGRGQRLRGLKHKQHRPDLIILDDLENDVNVRNPEIVGQILDWVKSAVYPSLDANGTLMIIGTILLHPAPCTSC